MKFAVIKERKSPPDKRVVLTPTACQNLLNTHPKAQVVVESSDIRAYTDQEYKSKELKVSKDINDADIMIGVKEVPIAALIPNKSYFFFSHTIKKQPYNRKLLRAILDKNITLYDHETLVDHNHNRLIGFGYYAGIVGAYNGIRTIGLKWNIFKLPKAVDLKGREELNARLNTISLPNLKIILTGTGRVGQGAKEILDFMNIKQVDVNSFLTQPFSDPVYVQLDVMDYVLRNDGGEGSKSDFFANPTHYKSIFSKFTTVADVFIAGHFYGKGSPYFFTRSEAKAKNFKLKVVADISCDIDGPVACTIRASTIEDPIYGYDPHSEQETTFNDPKAIAVMAVDNLPCELPRDASEGFGNIFVEKIIPAFFNGDEDGVLSRAKMTENGQLTPAFLFLKDYVEGLE